MENVFHPRRVWRFGGVEKVCNLRHFEEQQQTLFGNRKIFRTHMRWVDSYLGDWRLALNKQLVPTSVSGKTFAKYATLLLLMHKQITKIALFCWSLNENTYTFEKNKNSSGLVCTSFMWVLCCIKRGRARVQNGGKSCSNCWNLNFTWKGSQSQSHICFVYGEEVRRSRPRSRFECDDVNLHWKDVVGIKWRWWGWLSLLCLLFRQTRGKTSVECALSLAPVRMVG